MTKAASESHPGVLARIPNDYSGVLVRPRAHVHCAVEDVTIFSFFGFGFRAGAVRRTFPKA